MGRTVQLALLLTVFLAAANGSVTHRRDAHPYRNHWKHSTFGKSAVGGVVVGAGIGQWRGHPRSYGGGMAGFGKRLGVGFATHAVKTTVQHAVAAPLHEDLHYHRSYKKGVGPRLAYALKSTVITRSTRTGKHHPAVGTLSGHAAAGAVSQGALHAGSGAATAGFGLAAEAGANVAREFWPRPHRQHAARRAFSSPHSRASAPRLRRQRNA